MVLLTLLAVAAALISPSRADTNLEGLCQGIDAGIFPHPDPKLCFQYFSCAFEQLHFYECNAGFVFDEEILACVPGAWEDCGREVTTQNPELELMCSEVSYGVFEYEDNCGKFVFCERGNATVFECLENEIWVQEKGVCVFGNRDTCTPGDVFCMGRPDGPIPHPDGCEMFIECVNERSSAERCPLGYVFLEGGSRCVVGSSQTCQSLEYLCVDHPNESHAHPDLCGLFIKCEQTRPTIVECGENEVFRPDIQFCVPGNVQTCVPSRPEVACKGRPDGIVPHPDECNQFISCTGGTSSVQNCPIGQILRPEIPFCVAGDSDTCEFLDGVCVGRPNAYVIEHPNYCGMFIWCQNEQVQVHNCPVGEILRPDMQFCVPGNLDNCEVTPIEEMCDGRQGPVIYPHPYRCDQFIICEQGSLNVNTCAPDTVVQPGTIRCVPGNPQTCALYNDLCIGRPDGVIPHPSRCHLFIDCYSQQVTVSSCPQGHIFDSGESRCIPGNTETCDHLDEYCVNKPDGVISHPNRCDLFMRCSGGVTSVHQCPWGEILRPDMQFCAPGNGDTCQFTPIEGMCDNRVGPVIYPHPENCYSLIRCLEGQTTIEPCRDGMVLRPGVLQCVAGNRDTCELYSDRCIGVEQDLIPHPSECHVFLRCSSGQVSVESCSRGNIFYTDVAGGSCVVGDRDSCTSLQQTCGALSDQIIEHPNFCDVYIECRSGTTSMRTCSAGLILHPNMQVCTPGDANSCDFIEVDEMCQGRSQVNFPLPDQSQCSDFVTCTNSVATVNSCQDGTVLRPRFLDCAPGEEATCQSFPHICLFRPNEFIPHPTRCDLFVSCISEIPHVVPCARGEIFNPGTGMCVPGNAENCEFFTNICHGHANGILEHPNHCDLFIVCTSGSAAVHPCPTGEILHTELRYCMPGNPKTCELLPIQDMCDGRLDGTFPHPDCEHFIWCVDGSSEVGTCPVGNIYNAAAAACVPGNRQTCELYNDRCRGQQDGIISFPSRCDLFILCSSGTAFVHPCPTGEIVNVELQLCVPGNMVTCDFHSTTPQPPIMSICEDRSDGRYPHPFQCYMFIQCLDGRTDIVQCLPGEIFIPAVGNCAPGNQETCAPNEVPPGEITDDICVRAGIYTIPHPFVCYKYIRCVFRTAWVEECPRLHVFSVLFNICVPGDRNDC